MKVGDRVKVVRLAEEAPHDTGVSFIGLTGEVTEIWEKGPYTVGVQLDIDPTDETNSFVEDELEVIK